jgi:hypothetical protein
MVLSLICTPKDVYRVPLMAGVGSADQSCLTGLDRRIENDAGLQRL